MLLPIAMGLAGFTAAPLFLVTVTDCEVDFLNYLEETGTWPMYIGFTLDRNGHFFVFSSLDARNAMHATMESFSGCNSFLHPTIDNGDLIIQPSIPMDCPSCAVARSDNPFVGTDDENLNEVQAKSAVRRIKCSDQSPCLCLPNAKCPEYEYVFATMRCTFEHGCYSTLGVTGDVIDSLVGSSSSRSKINRVVYDYIGEISDSCDVIRIPPSSAVPAGASIDILSCPDDDDNIIVWIVVPIGIVAVVGGIAYWYFRCRGKNDSDNTVLALNLL